MNIQETLDSPSDLDKIPPDSFLHQMGEFSAMMVGGSNFGMHKIPHNGYLIHYDKDGATEIHHVDDDLKSGYKKSGEPSFKFVSTVASKIKDTIDSGKKVRISAHENLAPAFERITRLALKKNPGYKMSEPVKSEHELTGDKIVSWEMSK